MKPHPGGLDPNGDPRTIPVSVGGVHKGLIVWFSQAEYDRYWSGVDREVSMLMARGLGPDD